MTKRAGRGDILVFVKAAGNNWDDSEGCDICNPITLEELAKFLKEWGDESIEDDYCAPPWLCDDHARELGLLW